MNLNFEHTICARTLLIITGIGFRSARRPNFDFLWEVFLFFSFSSFPCFFPPCFFFLLHILLVVVIGGGGCFRRSCASCEEMSIEFSALTPDTLEGIFQHDGTGCTICTTSVVSQLINLTRHDSVPVGDEDNPPLRFMNDWQL